MQWRGRRTSTNVQDVRRGGGRMAVGGGLGGVILVVAYLLLGGNPSDLAQMGGGSSQYQSGQAAPGDDAAAQFVSVVLADTEDIWGELFRKAGRQYREPKLVLFSGRVESACGLATAASGPFYCPADERVYIDLEFYRLLKERFGAPGDFAQAYVIAHEVGHHVQKQLGATQRVHSLRGRVSEAEYNAASVRLELQADFYAGVWAHHADRAKQVVEPGDIEEALNAAHAIGDDRLQQQQQGYVVPDSFAHGTSEQRMRWFRKGYETGDPAQGDTFAAETL